ncbi:hypothetical protein B0H16DRAFT_1455051 [Mycena metata]|uniref:Uncharacterized protein n=1 Tax=Mycena metata TaxID=1033252 RepID=A0AAD7NJR4_9AGAR|nr:hypothetical protein B0H16DRAFT_1455051 [Mycena metata]
MAARQKDQRKQQPDHHPNIWCTLIGKDALGDNRNAHHTRPTARFTPRRQLLFGEHRLKKSLPAGDLSWQCSPIKFCLGDISTSPIGFLPSALKFNEGPERDYSPDMQNLMEANGEGDFALSANQQAVASISETTLDCFGDLPMSDDKFEDRSDDGEPPDEPEVARPGPARCCTNPEEVRARRRARTKDMTATSSFWYSWPDCITCNLDILMHLPRSVFSQRQLDLFLWLLKVNNVDDVPSVKSMQTINLPFKKSVDMVKPKVGPHLHSASEFLMDFLTLQTDAARYNLPHPSLIVFIDSAKMSSTPRKYTNPVLGNRWRAKAEGHRVVTFPIWMYCDDTSGNISKKWNNTIVSSCCLQCYRLSSP